MKIPSIWNVRLRRAEGTGRTRRRLGAGAGWAVAAVLAVVAVGGTAVASGDDTGDADEESAAPGLHRLEDGPRGDGPPGFRGERFPGPGERVGGDGERCKIVMKRVKEHREGAEDGEGERTVRRLPARHMSGEVQHGELVVSTEDGTSDVLIQTGEVTDLDEDTLTVRSDDGFEADWTVTGDTAVRQGCESADVDDLDTGDQVRVVGEGADESGAARMIHVRD